ncbi:MAG TPA: cytochrome c oxidase subunit 3 [Verrucomicrobiae bacterium]|jgi:cytochrome c oxidase subunit 3|nr:cytochrome c oxidase subunit 3 [Verrucomicrobiae bacterium]
MDIPYTVQPRPDIGLYNAKLGIWLFLASEVMLFGGLFSAYVLLRVGAAPGYWPHGWLDVRFGTLNTIILALSAITTLLAWVACKVGQFGKFKFFHACTLVCALTFLCIKMYEYHDKLIHYEIKLNDGTFADGHFESAVYVDKATNKEIEEHSFRGNAFSKISGGFTNNYELASVTIEGRIVKDETLLYDLRSQKNIPRDEVKIERAQIKSMQNYGPWHNTFLAIYFTLTGLHALHILGGSIVIGYLWGPGSKLWKRDPERFTNRIEVSGLFWHFVDLVWIFLFPVLYLT